jgi:hypothetical protein
MSEQDHEQDHGVMSEEEEARIRHHEHTARLRFKRDMRAILKGYRNGKLNDEDYREFEDHYRHSTEFRAAELAVTGNPDAGYADAEPWSSIYPRLLEKQRQRYADV